MKYIKLFALTLSLIGLASCSDDAPKLNTDSGVTVEMEQSTVTFSETSRIVKVPVVVSGTTNGVVKVDVKVEGTGANPCIPYADHDGKWSGNYIVTDHVVRIGAGENKGYVEINLIDDKDENEDRELTITIVSAEGAKIGEPISTVVTVRDNDGLLYDSMAGEWTFKYINVDTGNEVSEPVVISVGDYGTRDYTIRKFIIEGLGFKQCAIIGKLDAFKDGDTSGRFKISYGQGVGVYADTYDIKFFGVTPDFTSLVKTGDIYGTYDKKAGTITFEQNPIFCLYALLDGQGAGALGFYAFPTMEKVTE